MSYFKAKKHQLAADSGGGAHSTPPYLLARFMRPYMYL